MPKKTQSVHQAEPSGLEQFLGLPPAHANPPMGGLVPHGLGDQGEVLDAAPELLNEDLNNPQPDDNLVNGAEAGAEAQPPINAPANAESEEGN